MRLRSLFLLATLCLVIGSASARAAIQTVVETNLGTDPAAIIVNGGFAEDAVVFSDRVHQHNGPAFGDSSFPFPLPTGTAIPQTNVALPAYLVGGDYVRFANGARDNVGYSAVVTADGPSDWYLLIDNRWDGPNGINDSASFIDDPVLGGKLQWVIDDGWQRVNTGISPYGMADYTAVDESPADGSALGVGPGVSVNNFYAVYTRKNLSQVTLHSLEMSGASMYSLVSVPEPASLSLGVWSVLGLAAARRYRR